VSSPSSSAGPGARAARTRRGAVWVVLPTYDEAANLERLVHALRAELETCTPEGYAVLVVDDASPDGTGRIADRLAGAHPEVRVLHRPGKAGFGPAYRAGFDVALANGAAVVVQMDADFSHDPHDVGRLLAHVRDGADVVLGSRYVAGGGTVDWGRWRRAQSRGGGWYARTVLGLPVRDPTSGYRAMRAGALRTIRHRDVRARGYGFQVEMTYRAIRCGLTVAETPIVLRDRTAGRSKMTSRIALEAAWRVARLRLVDGPAGAPRPDARARAGGGGDAMGPRVAAR